MSYMMFLILCRLFSAALRGLHIWLHIDTTIVVAVINKGTARGTSGWNMSVTSFGYLLAIIFG
jgi:hypothetical protein